MNINSNSLNYNDLAAMQQLGTGDKANSEGNLRKVAEQFESLFLNMMVKSMRDANAVFGEDNPLNSNATKMYQDMYDNQLTVHMAEKQGVGLADVLMRQLSPKAAPGPAAQPAPLSAAVSGQDHSALLAQRRLAIVSRYAALQDATSAPPETSQPPVADQLATRRLAAQPTDSQPTAAVSKPASPFARFDNPEQFVSTLLPMAEKAAQRLGVEPRYLVAQAALETGWGRSMIKSADGGSSYNLFGIKSHGGWQGEKASTLTHEYREGQRVKEQASFRSYASFEQSFEDYVDFLQSNGRYSQALTQTDNPDAFFRALQKAGYATDPHYASKVSQIARQLAPAAEQLAQQDNAAVTAARA
ncbi:flagellar assembly peptidoglycan hydrolase FlgJ [Halopseudomonas salegens]|uniref:Peptidoglycan hydrolase FlgJ n=1 Tax=Halopseudomonas salegens TaxID=1434072 RepID=A0A1H2GCG6_9GAMM|nr:flagellar assembly peptidoglycan hydrolase FlgJ [Halopseudomonas salegens]SDU17245.1 flagellar protein FlgJ [Halopseudomonas salegens]